MTAEELNELIEQEVEANKGFTHSVNVCVAAGCLSSHADQTLAALKEQAKAKGLDKQVKVKGVGCMGLCAAGPLVEIRDAQGAAQVMYQGVQAENAADVVSSVGKEPVKQLVCDTSVPFFAKQVKIVLENCGLIDPERIEEYLVADGYRGLEKCLHEHEPDAGGRGSDQVRPARPRRRRLPDRPEVVHRRQGPEQAEVRHLQRRRRRSGRVHGPLGAGIRSAPRARRHGHRGLRHRRQPRLHLLPRGVSAGGEAAEDRDQAGREDRRAGPGDHGHHLQLHHRGAPGRRRVCVRRRDGPDPLDRRQARHAASPPAVPGAVGPVGLPHADQQRRDLRERSADPPQGRRMVRLASAPRRARAPRCSRWPAA